MAYSQNNFSNQGSGFQRENIYSNGLTFFSEEGLMLRVSFMNTCISISFSTPVDNGMGGRTYPRENRVGCLVTQEGAIAFWKKLVSAKENFESGKEYNGSVFLKRDGTSLLGIEITSDGKLCLKYYMDIDSQKKTTKIMMFTFKTIPAGIDSYNPNTGEGDLTTDVPDFELFVKTFEAFVLAISFAFYHSINFGDNKFREFVTSCFNALLVNNGMNPPNPMRPGYGTPKASNYSTGYQISQESTNSTIPQVQNVTSLDDLPF